MKRSLLLNNTVVLPLAAPDYSEDLHEKTSADSDGKQHSGATFLSISSPASILLLDIYS